MQKDQTILGTTVILDLGFYKKVRLSSPVLPLHSSVCLHVSCACQHRKAHKFEFAVIRVPGVGPYNDGSANSHHFPSVCRSGTLAKCPTSSLSSRARTASPRLPASSRTRTSLTTLPMPASMPGKYHGQVLLAAIAQPRFFVWAIAKSSTPRGLAVRYCSTRTSIAALLATILACLPRYSPVFLRASLTPISCFPSANSNQYLRDHTEVQYDPNWNTRPYEHYKQVGNSSDYVWPGRVCLDNDLAYQNCWPAQTRYWVENDDVLQSSTYGPGDSTNLEYTDGWQGSRQGAWEHYQQNKDKDQTLVWHAEMCQQEMPLYDCDDAQHWYFARYPEISNQGYTSYYQALQHYKDRGAAEGRAWNGAVWYDANQATQCQKNEDFYRARNPDIADRIARAGSGYQDWVSFGRKEGRHYPDMRQCVSV